MVIRSASFIAFRPKNCNLSYEKVENEIFMRKLSYKLSVIGLFSILFFLTACSSHPDVPSSAKNAGVQPGIYPVYCDVTVPCNIAPLNFMLSDEAFDE